MFNKNARKYIIKATYILRVRLRWNAERAEPKKAKKGNDWGFDPGNSYRNAKRFLRFPISVTLNPAQRARDSNPRPAWDSVPNPAKNLRFLNFPIRFAAA